MIIIFFYCYIANITGNNRKKSSIINIILLFIDTRMAGSRHILSHNWLDILTMIW